MIAHVSIPSGDPRATAMLFAALIEGQAFPFPVVPEAWIAVAGNGSGLAIEVYPDGMAHHPGRGEAGLALVPKGPATKPWEDQIFVDGSQLRPSAFHLAIATKLDDGQVFALAQEAEIRAIRCERGGVFGLIELWIDNTILVEVLTDEDIRRYRDFMNPVGCAAMFGPGMTPEIAA
jgi:hypothetical protein